jgi:hypothetical protein
MRRKVLWLAVELVGLVWIASAAAASSGFYFPRKNPEEVGVSSDRLLKYIEALDAKVDGMHSVMLVVKGSVIAEGSWIPYTPKNRHTMF